MGPYKRNIFIQKNKQSMPKLFLLLISFLFSSFAAFSSGAVVLLQDYTGKINNKLEVFIHLEQIQDSVHGFYYYKKSGVDIRLTGIVQNDSVFLTELNEQGLQAAFIKGKIKDSSIAGNWQNAITKKKFSLYFVATTRKIIPIPSTIDGLYKFSSENCTVSLEVKKDKGTYAYLLKTSKIDKKGILTFHRDFEETTFTLEGIQVAEDYFDNPSEDLHIDCKGCTRRIGIKGFVAQDGLFIQNSGNQDNYYVQLAGCEEKYLHLKK